MKCYDQYVVAYIDVLGTKAREVTQKEKVLDLFHDLIQRNEDRQKNFQKAYSRKVWGFSDCAFIAYYENGPLPHTKGLEVVRPMLINLPIEILRFWDEGFLVRGGIALGTGFFDDKNDKKFGGEAFEKAASLGETKKAPPCIFVDKKTAETFLTALKAAAEHRQQNNDIPDFLRQECPSLWKFPEFILKEDDYYYLNVLHLIEDMAGGVGMEDRYIQKGPFRKKMNDFAENEIAKAQKNDRADVIDKWTWMKKYINERLTLYPDDDPMIDLSAFDLNSEVDV